MSHDSEEKKIETDHPNLQLLNTSDMTALKHYEERFYQAYIHLEKQNLIRKIWEFDDTYARIKTKISYSDQIIFNFRERDYIFGAIAFNVSEREFQYSEFGFCFSPQPKEKTRICEILTMFSEKNQIDGRRWVQICQMLADHGFTDLVATSAPRPMPMYRRVFQFKVIDSNVIDGETRYFIHINLGKLLNKERDKNDDT